MDLGAKSQPNSNSGQVRICQVVFKLPPLAEQTTRIVAEAERRLSMVEELGPLVSTNLRCATHLIQFILQKAFTGGLL